MNEWFETWFDSKYYHLLYQDRNEVEAKQFIEKICTYITPSSEQHILDLACGKGRHSVYLNKTGAFVDGCDYSTNSIEYARQFENEKLHFYKHDMRSELPKSYHYIFNLFTSFGYFETIKEHEQTLTHIYNGLHTDGLFIFDYMNAAHAIDHLTPQETIFKGEIQFHIRRQLIHQKLIKSISFKDQGVSYQHQEKVTAFFPNQLIQMMRNCGFTLLEKFGNYNLDSFDLQSSKRLILILQK